MKRHEDILEVAHNYASMDLPIIPLCSYNHVNMGDRHRERCKTPGKAPVLKKWSSHTHTTNALVDEWFQRNSLYNIGMVLGQSKYWNIVGVDIDGALGEETWQALTKEQEVPNTWEYTTGGGRRLLFLLPEGLQTKKTKICWKEGHEELAFLAQGQQTVMPPSIHPSGKLYQWIDECSPFDADIADAPDWIIKKITQKNTQTVNGTEFEVETIPNFYGEEISKPVTVQEYSQDNFEGSRSDWMTRFVGSLCAKRDIPKETVVATAISQNQIHCKPPLSESEIRAMVESIWESEQTKHQQRLERQRKKEEYTPRVLAELFEKEQFEKGIHWIHFMERDQFYNTSLEHGPWQLVPERIIISEMESFLHSLDPQLARRAKIIEVLDALKSRLIRKDDGSRLDIGKHPNMQFIVLKNGILDWRNGKLKPWDPKLITTLSINATWNPDSANSKAADKWDKALHAWLPDEDSIKFLQEYIGYCLLPTCGMRTATFLFGEGANGKSLFIDVVTKLFDGHVAHTQPQALIRRFGTTVLIDKTMAVCSDIDSTYLSNTGILKQIIAGDSIAAEYKGGSNFSFTPVARMLFSANTLPKSSDKSHGWYSRLRFVKFPFQFEPDPVYKADLERTMEDETGLSVLLTWAVEGLQRLTEQGKFTHSDVMEKAKETYKAENDSVIAFANEQLIPSGVKEGNHKTSLITTVVYQVYTEWCDCYGMKAVSQIEFGKRLKAKQYEQKTMKFLVGSQWKSRRAILDVQWTDGMTEFEGSHSYNLYLNVKSS